MLTLTKCQPILAAKMVFTAKKRAYVAARLAGKNIRDSAIKAGYSEATAQQSGSRLEKDPDVQAAIARAKAKGKIIPPKNPPQKPKSVDKTAPKSKKKAAPIPGESQDEPAKMPDWASMLAPPPAKKSSKKTDEKAAEDEPIEPETDDPLIFMRHMMKNRGEDPRLRLRAAEVLAAFTIPKPGDKGKKEEQKDAAKEVAKKFVAIAPPVMKLVKK
jgi:phage terminase small subunit